MSKGKFSVKKMVYAAMFLAIALVLPFLTGQIPQYGSMLLPMHLPVLLAGFVLGGFWGAVVGFVAPLLRSLIFGMPPMFPTAIAMAFELLTYGLVAGLLYKAVKKNYLGIVLALLGAMVAGRIVWGVVDMLLLTATGSALTFQMFLTAAVLNAIPGIVLQIVVIPAIVFALQKAKKIPVA